MFNPLSLITSSPYAVAIKAGLILVAVIGVFSAGSYAGYRWEHSKVLELQLADQKTLTAAVQAAAVVQKHEDDLALAAAVSEAKAQTRIVTQTVTVTKEIPTYVHDQIRCPGPTVGLARVLRAAAEGADPAALHLAPGQSDDDCSDVTPTEVAGWFAAYAGAAQANTEQLTALQNWVTAEHKVETLP